MAIYVDGVAANRRTRTHGQAEGPGLQVIAEGFRHLGYKDDHALNAAEWIVYGALYEYCREMLKRGKPAGQFAIERA